jgi:NTE family protein
MSGVAALARSPLFEGLSAGELHDVLASMRPVTFAAGEAICCEGEPGSTLFVLVDGVADVLYPGGRDTEVRLRNGDVIGEMAVVSGEARSATVVATIPTTALELDQETFVALVLRQPVLAANVSRIVSRRLARTRRNQLRDRGEAVALLLDPPTERRLAEIVDAVESASPRPVNVVDARASLEQALATLDDVLITGATVLVLASRDNGSADHVLEHASRAIAVGEGFDRLDRRVERITLEDGRRRDVAWLGRHLARTKLGLALGAGGAKGYAHVGVLRVLEEAGYVVDCIAGASIGGIVGALHGLGLGAAEIEARLRRAFSPERVERMFKLSFTGAPTDLVAEAFREATEEKTFDDLIVPLAVMAVDLVSRRPAPITDGPLWEALMAATALAGMYPPYERGEQRLVDGLALVPVPTGTAVDLGADVTLSVNILNRDTLAAWPGDVTVPEAPPPARGAMMLDTMLEVMDLSQLESSIRHAELADVVVSPRFGPASWRDFHLADLFIEAGRHAAREQLALLHTLARPQPGPRPS